MSPHYFAHVPLFEALRFAAGVQRRYRAGWEQARFSSFVIARPNYKELDFDGLLNLPWEKKAPAESEEERLAALADLRRRLPMYKKLISKENG